ncbi:CYCLIN-DEPENDENT PROTEIN KINASE INHIBITOR SMR2-LIKE [Salix purpurea]|uniref:CYCLIN-DEPENDENT PROTEIN KINASE INHIBITOR SMR2-LIKE n=1 Tax=Salix purpurea TaxID=77065 RepID=A0A9Q1ABY4_SALPP|nr:CYCLIN-DEPENDENT PROTEIN KINASE INHIBITOR SMR2-LIKE [Salix purpurea]
MSKDHMNQRDLPEPLPSAPQDHEQGGGELGLRADDDDQEQCRTPTSSEHKIPTIQSCPPTPRKKVQVFAQKRKLPEFFETTNKDEVESFFRSSFEIPSSVNRSRPVRRRCRSY